MAQRYGFLLKYKMEGGGFCDAQRFAVSKIITNLAVDKLNIIQ